MFPARSKQHLTVLAFLAIVLLMGLLFRIFGNHLPENVGDPQTQRENVPSPSSRFSRIDPSYHSVESPRLPSSYERRILDFSLVREEPEFFWQEIQETLSSVIYDKIPEVRLSEGDLRGLTQNIRSLQDSMEGLRALDRTRENVVTIRNLRSQLDWNHQIFQETLGMSVVEFIQQVREKDGIDHDGSDEEEVVVDYLWDSYP